MQPNESTTEKRPVVAVSMTLERYGSWVTAGSADVRLLTPNGDRSLDGVSGLLLTGGEDVDPALYGELNRCSTRINRERDRFELALVTVALSRNLPILAVCRGMQLVVVAFGGKLYQDLSECASEMQKVDPLNHRSGNRTDTAHMIDIMPVSLLATNVRTPTLLVNSHHHQGIRIMPPSLRIAARSQDGLIEAVESGGNQSILGVQWHPERWECESSSAIMQHFVDLCEVYAHRT